jgi:hypothetical protein
MSDQDQNPFVSGERKTFKMLGKEFVFEFIPGVHFTWVMSIALQLSIGIFRVGTEVQVKPEATGDVASLIREALESRQYEILQDVLKWQNNHIESMEALKYKTRPTEIAAFLVLLLDDKEVKDAVEVLMQGMGESVTNILTPLVMPNSTPSS